MLKQALMKIWKDVFHDTDDFIHLFFERVYKEDNVQFLLEDERIVSSLHMVPYKLNYKGLEIPTSYICGAATAPDARNKGLMGKLLNQSFETMKKRNIPISVLIPANEELYTYYQHFGYKNIFHQQLAQIKKENLVVQKEIVVKDNEYSPELFAYFDSEQRKRPCSILHDSFDFETICMEHKQADALLLTSKREGRTTGFMFAIPNSHTRSLFISESFSQTIADRDAMLHQAFQCTEYDICWIRSAPTSNDNIQKRGMLKIIDRKPLLELIDKNRLNPSAFSDSWSDEVLLQHLFHNTYPYMNLMLD